MNEEKSAHDQFKANNKKRTTLSYLITALLYGLLVLFLATASVPVDKSMHTTVSNREVRLVQPPEVSVPSAPEAVSKPKTPTVPEINVNEDITIPETTFEENPVEELPPPPSVEKSERPAYIPNSVMPYLKNKDEIVESLRDKYPNRYQDAGIGGRVIVDLKLSDEGLVEEVEIHISSGYDDLDRVAQEVARTMLFKPAIHKDKTREAWVRVPIVFNPSQ